MNDMNAETLEALKGSVRKWNRIFCKGGVNLGPTNCPLCKLFVLSDCEGCPVSAKSGRSGCHGTPYYAFGRHHLGSHPIFIDHRVVGKCRSCKKHAKAERDFLASLLPSGEKWR